MTRRERHIRIVQSWGSSATFEHELRQLMARHGVNALSDEALRELATNLTQIAQQRKSHASQ